MVQTRRQREVLVLLLIVCALVGGAIVWRTSATGSQTQPSRKPATVFTSATDSVTCVEQARVFTDYPLVFAGPSVLGYPLTSCQHMRTETLYAPDGRVSHPGGDSWSFVYGTCTIPEGRENCTPPIGIGIDPCALIVDGRTIPKASQPTRGITVRGVRADVVAYGISFEQAPQVISISAPGSSPDERAANAALVADALIPANGLASSAASALAAKPGAGPESDTLLAATLATTNAACP